MASPNLDLVRSIYAAWERGDFGRTDGFHPKIEWAYVGGPEPGEGTGLAGMGAPMRDWLHAWKEWHIKATEYLELDRERILVFGRGVGRGKTSGMEVGQLWTEGANLFEVHDGKVTAGCYQGHDGMRQFFRDFEEVWGEEIRVEPEVYFDLGDDTLLFLTLRGRGRQSGLDVVMASAHMARWRDGLLIYFKAYPHREDALKDLRVSEQALEPIDP